MLLRRMTKILASSACLLVSASLIASPAMADEGQTEDQVFTYSDEAAPQSQTDEGLDKPAVQPAGVKVDPYWQIAENAHKSSSGKNGSFDVSGHACWKTKNKHLLKKEAKVKGWLQYKTTSGKWKTVATATPVTVPQGCGRGKRASARIHCKPSSKAHLWRTVADVDIKWTVDLPQKTYGRAMSIKCGL